MVGRFIPGVKYPAVAFRFSLPHAVCSPDSRDNSLRGDFARPASMSWACRFTRLSPRRRAAREAETRPWPRMVWVGRRGETPGPGFSSKVRPARPDDHVRRSGGKAVGFCSPGPIKSRTGPNTPRAAFDDNSPFKTTKGEHRGDVDWMDGGKPAAPWAFSRRLRRSRMEGVIRDKAGC